MEIQNINIALIFILPLVSAIASFLVGNKQSSGWVASLVSFLIFIIALFVFIQNEETIYQSLDWFTVGQFTFQVGFLLDKLSAIMLVVVSLVTLLVNIFSIEYMKHDEGKNKYFAFLGLFAFSMYGIILSSNLFLTFCFWELVGFASYLLIGFWHQEIEPPKASFKAFMVNRVGDAGFLIALFILFAYFKTFELPILYNSFSTNDFPIPNSVLTVLGLGLFLGAVGKSAQFPLQTWLPDAMAGPTPVSALIHAATMVAAGVFMLIRVFPMLASDVITVIAYTGAITAFMGAFAAFAQNDIKKVLAFSTVSQLGYMMIAIGTNSPEAAFFHLTTHAFFKAGLFLCAGAVIHMLHKQYHDKNDFDAQDMKNMGGLRKKIPYTFIAYTVCMLAICGLPFFSGYFSKEAIITSAILDAEEKSGGFLLVPIFSVASVFMTAAYMGRQYFMVFFGELKNEVHEQKWTESKLMVLPIMVLSILSVWFWYGINPIGIGGEWLTSNLLIFTEPLQSTHSWWISILSIGLATLGLLASYFIYVKGNISTLQLMPNGLMKLSSNNWYLDEIHKILIVKPVLVFSSLSGQFDKRIVDGSVNAFGVMNVLFAHLLGAFDRYVVDGLVALVTRIAFRIGNMTRSIQGGKVQLYYVWAIAGILLIYIFVF